MADALQKDDFRFPFVEDEPEESRGKVMANQAPREDPIRRRARVSRTDMGLDLVSPDRQLSEWGNIRLNRAAERVGEAVGQVVFQARRVPDSARERLRLIRDRAQQLADAVVKRAQIMATTAQERADNLMDRVEESGRAALDEVDHLNRKGITRASQLKEQVTVRSREWKMKARVRAEQIRMRGGEMINGHPLKLLGCIAGAALITGISLRIVRARNARRY